jgi:CheY-like chemotaxis protein
MIIKAIEKAKAITQKGSALMIMSSQAIERGAKYHYQGPNGPTNSAEEPKIKEIRAMTQSILDGKRILAIDDEPDVLAVLEEEIMYKCPNSKFEKATNYEDAKKLLESQNYDVVVLDIMGVRGFDLLEIAVKRNLKVAMLTAHALTPEALKRSYEMKARAYLPKNKLGEVVPFLEDVLKYDYQSGWKRLFEKLHGFFSQAFESDWEKKTGMNWREWGK